MKEKAHLLAVFQALLVTLLWSSSFVIIKMGLGEIPPLLFAGLRYFIAFLVLLPFLFLKKYRDEVSSITLRQWIKLALLGIVFITFTQGMQFIGLSLLPSVTVSLWLNFTPIFVAFMSIFILNEIPTKKQWVGISLFIVGVFVYFIPVSLEGNLLLGLIIMTIGVLANASASIQGRDINRDKSLSPLVITTISMGIGSSILLAIGGSFQSIESISTTNILLLLWMAIVNTAFAFTLWNKTLRTLTAIESVLINNTMLIQIALLAWIFLGETITVKEGVGMLIAVAGIYLVQTGKTRLHSPSKTN
ncbi:MAG: DMT family transporter [Bacteroidetes bacterium]|nr:DMT family transporter [Bacteroidota bacterium]